MLFTEEQLQMSTNPFSILDEAVYLTESEATILPQMVPIVENNRLQSYIIDFNGIRQLSESTGLNYIDAAVLVAEQDGIDPSQACIAIDEADLIEDPELANLGPIVVRPLSELDDEFQFCLETVSAFMETEDEEFLDLLSEEADYKAYYKDYDKIRAIQRNHWDRNKDFEPLSWNRTNAAVNRMILYLRKKHGLPDNAAGEVVRQNYNKYLSLYKKYYKKATNKNEEAKESSTSIGSKIGSAISSITGSSNTGNTESKPSKIFHKIGGIGHKFKKTVGDVVEKAAETPPQEPPKPSSGGSKIGSAISSLIGSSTESTPKQEPPKPENTGWGFGTKAGIGAGIAAVIGGGVLAYNHYRDKPKSVIAKRIAALRSIYQKWMAKASSNKDSGIAAKLRRGAAKILQVIDKLMTFLQRKADGK